jgi:hypothetical protein
VRIFEQQHLAALRAHIQELLDAELSPAPQAAVYHTALVGRDQVRLDFPGELVDLHGVSTFNPPM